MAKLNTDKLSMLPREKAASAAHTALNGMSSLTPEEQMAGSAILFYIMCKHNGLTGQAMHDFGEKLIRPNAFHRIANIQIEALQDFAGFNHPTN